MNKYNEVGHFFYSQSLDVLIETVGKSGVIGPVFHVIYSGNEAYQTFLLEAVESFIDEHFVLCNFDQEKNELSFMGGVYDSPTFE